MYGPLFVGVNLLMLRDPTLETSTQVAKHEQIETKKQ
jgi:hypothetical protein